MQLTQSSSGKICSLLHLSLSSMSYEYFYERFVDGTQAYSMTKLRKQNHLYANLPQEKKINIVIGRIRAGPLS